MGKYLNSINSVSKLKKNPNVTLVFDEVSRMSRNADEGFPLYNEQYILDGELDKVKQIGGVSGKKHKNRLS